LGFSEASIVFTRWFCCVNTGESFRLDISDLSPGTVYEFWAHAKNSAGFSEGDGESFTTKVSPTVITQSAINIKATTATLRGVLEDDGGEACEYRFVYEVEDEPGTLVYTPWTCCVNTGESFSQDISDLIPGTVYDVWAEAKNSGDCSTGDSKSFITGILAPTVTTQPAIDVEETFAMLRGSIEDDGGEACECRFRCGYKREIVIWVPMVGRKTIFEGMFYKYTPWTGAKTTGKWFAKYIYDLSPGSTYYFNAQAKNFAGESDWGDEQSFTTRPIPVISKIWSRYCGPRKHTYYLDGVDLDETFTVVVDWKDRPPGKVEWTTPKATYVDTCPGTTVSRSFNMSTEFGEGGRLIAVAIAGDGSQSAPVRAYFDVIKPPPELPADMLRADTSGKQILYKTKEKWPLEAVRQGVEQGVIPDNIPAFGGKVFQFIVVVSLSPEIRGDGSVLAKISKTDLKAMSIDNVKVEPSVSVDLGWTYNSIKQSWEPRGLIKVFVKGKWEALRGRTFVWIIPVYWGIDLKSDLAAELDFMGFYSNDRPKWQGKILFKLNAEGFGGVGLDEIAALESYVGGGAHMRLEFPNEHPLQQLCLGVYGGFRVECFIKKWELPIGSPQWWCLFGDRPRVTAIAPLALALSDISEFELMERDYLGPDYAIWAPLILPEKRMSLMTFEGPPIADSEPDEEQLLQYNVFRRSQPTIAADGNDLLLAWIYDDPNRTSSNRTKVLFSNCENDIWSQPVSINDDGTADFSPQIATFLNGDALCVWENANRELPDDANLTDIAAAMEIEAAFYDSGSKTWISQVLTSNAHLDRTPRIAAADNDTGIAVWIYNEKDDILGLDPNAVNEIRYGTWDGINWSEPKTVAAGVGLILKTTLAYNGNQAVYAYTLDIDHNRETDTDHELYVIIYDGSLWSEPIQLTDDTLLDANPQVVYDDGDLLLMWYRDANLVSCYNLDMDNLQEVLPAVGFGSMDFRLAKSPAGQISLVWTDTSIEGVDIFTATYDPVLSIWSNVYQLTSDKDMERSLAATYAGFDELALAYNKVEIIDVNGIPEPNRVDLYILRHQIKSDLAIATGDISLSVVNPLPSSIVDINAVIHNFGDVAEVDVPVAFYNGDPDANGVLIGDVQVIAGPIPAAGSATASVSWLVPEVNEPQQIYVVVDPDFILEDANRNNNIASISVMAPDLTVAYIISEKTGPKMRTVTARVANTGVVPVQNVNVVIRQDSANGPELANFNIAQLDPNSFYDVSHDWYIIAKDFNSVEVPFYVIVDEPDTFRESNENNNVTFGLVQVGKVADVTDNGKIDPVDLFCFANSWLASCEEPDWCYGCDFNQSGRVDFADFAALSDSWQWQAIWHSD